MEKDVFDLDSIAIELEVSSDKIDVILHDIQMNCFTESNALHRHFNFDRNRIKTDIESDYLYKSRETVDHLWEKKKEANSKASVLIA